MSNEDIELRLQGDENPVKKVTSRTGISPSALNLHGGGHVSDVSHPSMAGKKSLQFKRNLELVLILK